MFVIKNVTAKNFLSIGNQTQAVNFNQNLLTLVLGDNIDLGGDGAGSRNGVGKTAILNALSYGLYGEALTKIKQDNLINHVNNKNMLVTVEFEKGGNSYRIERGRKPTVLKLYVNNKELKTEDENESQGDSRETQKSIEQMLEMSHTMFKHLVALNTYTVPFLSMTSSEQREIIEQLLGITLLSEKADNLKNSIKLNKEKIASETAKIDAIKTANDNVQKSINSLKLKSSAWSNKRVSDIESLDKAITQLKSVDIEQELVAHVTLKTWNENNTKIRNLNKQRATLESALSQNDKTFEKYKKELENLKNKKCPACEQDLHDHKHEEMLDKILRQSEEADQYRTQLQNEIKEISDELESIGEQHRQPITFYDTEMEALGHKNNLDSLEKSLIEKANESNPYDEQIEELENTAIQEIVWDEINKLSKLKDHQEFLHKLLTNKDSFIRKKIIDQNLAYLNKRLCYYIDKLGLPHSVVFQNDLSVEITQLGQDLDFGNLSRGERNRLVLSLSFAFRDVWESLYQSINLLFIDEVMDSGMDPAGVESGLAVLKKMARDRNKNIYLISHKDELVGRVNNVLRVVKEGGFTSYSVDENYVE